MAEQFPVDAIPANGWTLDLPGVGMTNAHIQKVTAFNRKTGSNEVVDGGSGRKFYFDDGIIDHGEIQVMRWRDGGADDAKYHTLFDAAVGGGIQAGTLTQRRHGRTVMTIEFEGMWNEEELGDLELGSGDPHEHTYTVKLQFWKATFNP
jgi:hypothetical protein